MEVPMAEFTKMNIACTIDPSRRAPQPARQLRQPRARYRADAQEASGALRAPASPILGMEQERIVETRIGNSPSEANPLPQGEKVIGGKVVPPQSAQVAPAAVTQRAIARWHVDEMGYPGLA
jgi:hypothetical protein